MKKKNMCIVFHSANKRNKENSVHKKNSNTPYDFNRVVLAPDKTIISVSTR